MRKKWRRPPPPDLDHLKSANVVVVLLESWPAFDMQSYARVANVPPFFRSIKRALFNDVLTCADGYRTV